MTIEPLLFSTSPRLVAGVCDAARPPDERVGAVVVDWERQDKVVRQADAHRSIGTDTQISTDTPDDLARVRSQAEVPVICRINAVGPWTREEIDTAARLGVDELLVPMVRSVADVEEVLGRADGVAVSVMIETADAVGIAGHLGDLPITRAYLGLMDLAIDRGTPSIFTALVDGTLDVVRERVAVPLGFGGLTVPGRGTPIPTRLLLGEMARLECGFSFLRRSFIADVGTGDPGAAVRAIRAAADAATHRPQDQVERDRAELVEAVALLDAGVLSAGRP